MTPEEKRIRTNRARPIKALLKPLCGYRLVFSGCYFDRAYIQLDWFTEEIELTDEFDRDAILDVCDKLAERAQDGYDDFVRSATNSVYAARKEGSKS